MRGCASRDQAPRLGGAPAVPATSDARAAPGATNEAGNTALQEVERELVDLARGQGDPSEIAARREKLENTKMIMEISLLAH